MMFCSHHTLDADGHGGGAMRNLLIFRALDHVGEGMFQNTEQLVGHLGFAPHESL